MFEAAFFSSNPYPLLYTEKAMSELDKLKEAINQMRLWIGILSVTDISLIGWAVSSYEEEKNWMIILAGIAIIALTGAIISFNKRVGAAIERLGDL